jgi:CDP-glucose 4,6-dehydratase
MGAAVTGLSSSKAPTTPSLFDAARVGELVASVHADIRDFDTVCRAIAEHAPEVLFHMAAQPFVRRSIREPRGTFETNVMGTVNVLEAVRLAGGQRVVVNVTSDKAYENRELGRPFVEDDPKGGHDPYSSSKGAAELVAAAYTHSFFPADSGPRVASARAGNVIGGGDWGEDRLVPDIMRAALSGAPIPIRHPASVRPWQHVLNALGGYLMLAEALAASSGATGGWNFGPDLDDVRPVSWIVQRLAALWPSELHWQIDPGPHALEAQFLSLDSTKARERLGWAPVWGLDEALAQIVAWYQALLRGDDVRATTIRQIDAFSAGD